MQVLILGCGYVGTAFGLALRARGALVRGTVRSDASAQALRALTIQPIIFQGALGSDNNDADLKTMAASADIVLASIPPNDDGDPGFVALNDVLNQASPSWIGYLSTTGVYGDRHGGWAFETDRPTPASPEATRRVAAEANWQSLSRPAHIFRLPGIYGPGRSALDQVRAGTARRIDRKRQVFSRAHRSDIVAALLASIAKPNPGQIYNICDDYPCASGDVVLEACRLLNVAPPPLVPFAEAGLSEMGQRFYSECKRVSNARAKAELGWRPQFPTYYEGLDQCLADETTL
jgi:nucleoside-diphosphate-sugar epimerase